MTTGSIPRHLIRFSIPLLIGNLFQQLYNTVDSIVVGNYVGHEALAAVGCTTPIVNMLIGLFVGLASGAGVVISQYYGARDREKLPLAVQTTVTLTLIMCAVLTVLGVLATPLLLRLMDTPDDVLPAAAEYLRIYFWGVSGVLLYNIGAGILRAVGDSTRPLYFLIFSALTNTVLDVLFTGFLGMGIAGSALATVISEAVSFFLLLFEMRQAGITPLGLRYVRLPHAKMLRIINNGGVPSFARQVMLGVATSLLNNAAAPYGDAAIAGIAVVQRITSVGNFFQIGIGQGFQPICGYNLGAKRYDRIREAYFTAIRLAFVSVAAIGVITFLFAPQLIAIFRDDPAVVAFGVVTLRLQSITMPFTGVAMCTNFMMQTSGKMWRATFLGACRLGLVLGPVVLVLPPLLGQLGVQIAQPVTDILTTLIAVPMAYFMLREMHAEEDKMMRTSLYGEDA